MGNIIGKAGLLVRKSSQYKSWQIKFETPRTIGAFPVAFLWAKYQFRECLFLNSLFQIEFLSIEIMPAHAQHFNILNTLHNFTAPDIIILSEFLEAVISEFLINSTDLVFDGYS